MWQSGKYYFITFLDEYYHYLKVVLLKSKNKTEKNLKFLIEHGKVEAGQHINFIKLDGSGEYTLDLLK